MRERTLWRSRSRFGIDVGADRLPHQNAASDMFGASTILFGRVVFPGRSAAMSQEFSAFRLGRAEHNRIWPYRQSFTWTLRIPD